MIFTDPITTDGNYYLPPTDGNMTVREKSTITISSNPDAAVVTFGYEDHDGNFKAYSDGVVAADDICNHGIGVKFMVNITGIITEPVVIGYSV